MGLQKNLPVEFHGGSGIFWHTPNPAVQRAAKQQLPEFDLRLRQNQKNQRPKPNPRPEVLDLKSPKLTRWVVCGLGTFCRCAARKLMRRSTSTIPGKSGHDVDRVAFKSSPETRPLRRQPRLGSGTGKGRSAGSQRQLH